MDLGSESILDKTVAPVVVNPDMDSKTASVKESSIASDNRNGKQPIVPRTPQNKVTTRKLSRMLRSSFDLIVGIHRHSPRAKVIMKAVEKAAALPSL